MMGRQDRDQGQLFYEFKLDDVVPKDHLLRRMNVFVTGVLADLHQQLRPFYSDIGRPSVDPELMIRMLIVGYCYGIRHERRLCEEVKLHLAYRWFCKLDLDDKVPHHSTFSINRLERFREHSPTPSSLVSTNAPVIPSASRAPASAPCSAVLKSESFV
jgi:transposase